jgi:hypothetical protein
MQRRPHVKLQWILAVILCCAGCAGCKSEPVASAAPQPPASLVQGGVDNPAPLSWLGPAPAGLTQEEVNRRTDAVIEKIKNDMSAGIDIGDFVCKTPAEVGPVPMMDAVERYIDGLPESRDDDGLLHGLNDAARHGNWIARAQIFLLMSDRRQADVSEHYRMVQLMEWMQERRLGVLYAWFGDAVAASGFYNGLAGNGPTGIDEYAALNGSYQAQYEVGRYLKNSNDPDRAGIGERMVACALGSLPAYARVFTGAAENAREARRERDHETTFSPLHRAVRDGDAGLVEELLTAAGTDVNAKTSRGYSPLDMAFLGKTHNTRIIRALIRRGADVAGNGAVDKRAGPHDGDEVLNRAVKAQPVNLEVLAMLIEAGAEPFKETSVNNYVGRTPFSDSFEAYESGARPEVLEFLLATKKLDARSELAGDYLERSVRYPKVMARLLTYGVPPEHAKGLLSEIAHVSGHAGTPAERQRYLEMASDLARRYPGLARSIRGVPGYEKLSQAIHICNFEYAVWLLDNGAPVKGASHHEPGALVSTTVERCDKVHSLTPDLDMIADRDRWRQVFLEKLKAKHYDFNVNSGKCPAWSSKGSMCKAPEDDSLVALLLTLGADPYRTYPGQRDSALESVIEGCRVQLLDLMLARPPRTRDAPTRQALQLALEATSREPWSGLDCPGDFMKKTARKLLSYGAPRSATP